VKIALREWNLDPVFGQGGVDPDAEIARDGDKIAAGPRPKLEIKRAVPETDTDAEGADKDGGLREIDARGSDTPMRFITTSGAVV